MSRRLSSRIVLFLIFAIIVLFALGRYSSITLLQYSTDTVAGVLSVALATFIFVHVKTLGKKMKVSRTILELLLVAGGLVILIPEVYNYILQLHSYLDILIIVGYSILLLLVAFFTRNQHVPKSDIRQANNMASGEFANDPKLKKLLKKKP